MSVKLIVKIIPFFLTISLLLICLFPAMGIAHNKVVVIPMFGEGSQLDPFAPLTSPSPPLSSYTNNGESIVDKITGLEWQKAGDSLDDLNPGADWDEAWEHCALLSLNSKTDWRLPSVSELMSIVSYGIASPNPAINYFAFSSTYRTNYWTATWKAGTYGKVWSINFNSGQVEEISDRPLSHESVHVRCVRSIHTIGSVLQDNLDHTVSDLTTGLLWQKARSTVPTSWAGAQEYCSNLEIGNHSDWRLPDIKELASIIDYRVHDPAIDPLMAPGTSSLKPFWSDTSQAGEATTNAFAAHFKSGWITSENKTAIMGYARCVR